MVFGSLWMVVFLALIIGLVVWGINRFGNDKRERRHVLEISNEEIPTKETAMEIARERLARGEINRKQFEEIQELFGSREEHPVGGNGRLRYRSWRQRHPGGS